MTTKNLIESELNSLTEEQLDQVYDVIKKIQISQENTKKPNLMAQLKQIEINAPQDFSVNLAQELGRATDE